MRKPILLLGLLFIAISLLIPYTLHADSILEEQIYKYVSIVYIDPPMTPEDAAWCQKYENELLAPIKAKTSEAIPILFRVLENDSTQNVWSKRLEKEGCSFAKTNIIYRTMYTIPEISIDTAIMDRLYRYIETIIIHGKDSDDFSLIICGIAALSKDSSENGLNRLIRLRQAFETKKYTLQNFDADKSLKNLKSLDSPEHMRTHFIRVINEEIQEKQLKSKKSILGN